MSEEKASVVPKCFLRSYDLCAALDEANLMLSALKENCQQEACRASIEESRYLEVRIKEITIEKMKANEEAQDILDMFRNKGKAYVLAKLHYIHALKWEDVMKKTGCDDLSIDTVKASVYREFKRLRSNGKIVE